MTPTTYLWAGGSEALLRFGPRRGPVVVAAMPPFEEANRTRALMTAILRALAERGVASALPDLPGAGDSSVDTEQAALNNWQSAFSAAAQSLRAEHDGIHIFAIRGGALVDSDPAVASRYHFAPVPGASLVRDMLRTRLAAARDSGTRDSGAPFDAKDIAPPGPPIDLAGNRLSRDLIADLNAAVPTAAGPIRIARLDTDAQAADIKFAAAPLWRRAEPGNDPALAELLADDIAAWIASCGA